MLIRPYLLPHRMKVNTGVAGIIVLADNAMAFPDGKILRVSSSEHQSLIMRSVRGVIPERVFMAYDVMTNNVHFVEENDDVVRLGPVGEGKYDVHFCNDSFFLKTHMPRLNLLTQEKDEGEVYLRLRDENTNMVAQNCPDGLSTDGRCVGSIDLQIPNVICGGWYVYSTVPMDYHLSIQRVDNDRDVFRTYVAKPDIILAGNVFKWGTEHFTLVDGRIVKVPATLYDQQASGGKIASLLCTVTTESDTITYSIR